MRVIRASELNNYVYCQRAWWYQKNGYLSDQHTSMNQGEVLHDRHGRKVRTAGILRTVAIGLIIFSLLLFAVYILTQTL